MTTTNDAILAVSEGDIVHLSGTGSFFRVTELSDPSHPLAPGVVWHGHYWLAGARRWGRSTVLHMHAGKPAPQVLSVAERKACGWGDRP